METVTVTVYSFDELSDDAKERALVEHQSAAGFAWTDEYWASIKALAAHFDSEVADYRIDWSGASHSFMRFTVPAVEDEELEEWLAAKVAALGAYNPDTLKGVGECVLTGFCGDEDAIDGLRRAFMAGVCDLGALLRAAFDSLMAAAHADYADFYSEEQFSGLCEASGYRFTADGAFFRL